MGKVAYDEISEAKLKNQMIEDFNKYDDVMEIYRYEGFIDKYGNFYKNYFRLIFGLHFINSIGWRIYEAQDGWYPMSLYA